MTDEKPDRRVQRTRTLLKNALMQLIDEKGYDAVTIQDITERANLGRTTFYLHYVSKDDLLLDHHQDFASHIVLQPLSYDELMNDRPAPAFAQFLQGLADGKAIYLKVTNGKDADLILQGVRQQMMDNLSASLQDAFADSQPTIALEMLVNYIIGAQLTYIDWWLTNRTSYDAQTVAEMLHQLQRAAVRDAFGVKS